MAPGLIACTAVLALATAAGLAWQARNGRMRVPGRLVAAPAPGLSSRAAAGPDLLITTDDLGGPLGTRATLVQFSTAFCAPCRATRQILTEVARTADGVAHVEIDAESHLDLVRKLDIRRTPTVLLLGPDGRIARRASGQPRRADVVAALRAVNP